MWNKEWKLVVSLFLSEGIGKRKTLDADFSYATGDDDKVIDKKKGSPPVSLSRLGANLSNSYEQYQYEAWPEKVRF